MIYSTRENIKSTLCHFSKIQKERLVGQFFCRAADVIDAVCGDVSAGWIVDLLTGENAGTADLDAGASGRRFDWDQ